MPAASNKLTPRVIRLAHPLAFAAYLRRLGAPFERYLRRQRLPVHCDDPDAFVPLAAAWSLFDAAAQSVDPMVGWHVGQFVRDHNLNGGLLRRFENAPTLYLALQQFIELIGSEASHLQLGLRECDDGVLFFTHYPDTKDMAGYDVSQAYQIEVYVALIQHFAGANWLPTEIGLERPDVPAGLEDRFPGTRILTRQPAGYVAVPRSCLHLAARDIESSDERGKDESLVLANRFDYVDTLRALLKAYVCEGYPSARFAASLMGTSVRTLARRLAERRLSYSAMVDQVRFETAKELLLNSNLRIQDVSQSIGFDDQAHFARMFRRVGGLSPRQFRQPMRDPS